MVDSLTRERFGPYGAPMRRGFNLARDEPNLPMAINLIPADDMRTAQEMTEAFENQIEMGVPAILGMAISSFVRQALPIAQLLSFGLNDQLSE